MCDFLGGDNMGHDDLSFVPRERRLEIDKIVCELEKGIVEKGFQQIMAESISFEEFSEHIKNIET